MESTAQKIVMVTGAGGGLGRALSRALARRGDVVIAIGRDAAALAETESTVDPQCFAAAVADVRDADALDRIGRNALERHGRIDALYANAAIYPRGHVHSQDPAEALDVLAVNVIGVANAIRAVLPGMMQRAYGRIVVLGSFADADPLPDSWAYSASKGALHALSRAVAAEVRGDFPDILVNEWVPGALRTRMGIEGGIDPDLAASWGLAWIDLPPGGPSGRLFSGNALVPLPASVKQRLLRRFGVG